MGLFSNLFKENKQNDIEHNIPTDGSFYFIVEDIFSLSGGRLMVVGKVISGEIHIGDTVSVGGRVNAVVNGIEQFRKTLDTATAGDNCGILLNGISKSDVYKNDYLTKL